MMEVAVRDIRVAILTPVSCRQTLPEGLVKQRRQFLGKIDGVTHILRS